MACFCMATLLVCSTFSLITDWTQCHGVKAIVQKGIGVYPLGVGSPGIFMNRYRLPIIDKYHDISLDL